MRMRKRKRRKPRTVSFSFVFRVSNSFAGIQISFRVLWNWGFRFSGFIGNLKFY
jgi:hypothetical protein